MRNAITALVTSLLLACSPALNWREIASTEGKFTAIFPGKPQVSVREIPFGANGGERIRMSMSAAGQDATLFAVGVAQLPAGAGPEVLNRFAQALLANTRMKPVTAPTSLPALRPDVLARARGAQALRARLDTAPINASQPTQLMAHLLLVDDRLYQIVALGDDRLADTDLETFFDAFKLLP